MGYTKDTQTHRPTSTHGRGKPIVDIGMDHELIAVSIRFAAPPTGSLRWQRPEAPAINRTTILANTYGPTCYQIGSNPPSNASSTNTVSEDCLFINVQSPANATNLPVLVWIHGGGYGAGNGRLDLSDLLTTNNNNFVAVSIQYRLGPFGFLASDELYKSGVVNAGLLDQFFALQWVQVGLEPVRSGRYAADQKDVHQ
jgi:carboxylesterase type B